MTELDQAWAELLGDAVERAGQAGRGDIADYLRLKASNDRIRAAGVKWLFDTIVEQLADAMRDVPHLSVERDEPHKFSSGNSNLVGSRLSVRHGVRCLSIEAGWVRSPGNGIMRSGSLALAKLSHFGIPNAGVELLLVHRETLPNWYDPSDRLIQAADLARHIDLLLSEQVRFVRRDD